MEWLEHSDLLFLGVKGHKICHRFGRKSGWHIRLQCITVDRVLVGGFSTCARR